MLAKILYRKEDLSTLMWRTQAIFNVSTYFIQPSSLDRQFGTIYSQMRGEPPPLAGSMQEEPKVVMLANCITILLTHTIFKTAF